MEIAKSQYPNDEAWTMMRRRILILHTVVVECDVVEVLRVGVSEVRKRKEVDREGAFGYIRDKFDIDKLYLGDSRFNFLGRNTSISEFFQNSARTVVVVNDPKGCSLRLRNLEGIE